MYSKPWETVEELLQLFDVPQNAAYRDLVGVINLIAIYERNGIVYDLNSVLGDLAEQNNQSRVVYLSRLKRAAAPMIAADINTLRALGLRSHRVPRTITEVIRLVVYNVKNDDRYRR